LYLCIIPLEINNMSPMLKLFSAAFLFVLFLISLLLILKIKNENSQLKWILIWVLGIAILGTSLNFLKAPHLWPLILVGLLLAMVVGHALLVPHVKHYWNEIGMFSDAKTPAQQELWGKNLRNAQKGIGMIIFLIFIFSGLVRVFADTFIKNPNIEHGFWLIFGSGTSYILILMLILLLRATGKS